jgi:hypothetical protein
MKISIENEWKGIVSQLNRDRIIIENEESIHSKWKLDFTEAKSRMRKKNRRIENITDEILQQSVAELSGDEKNLSNSGSRDDVKLPDIYAKKACNINMSETQPDIDGEINKNKEENGEPMKSNRPMLKINTELSTDNKTTKDDWEEVNLEESEFQKIQRILRKDDQVLFTINCGRLIGLELIGAHSLIQNAFVLSVSTIFI